ncbi:HD domain-containing protein [Leptospira sarikeiensis]|uniref:Metal-dependent phosphohydrolase n=1 Tax=Leptospira sarikeiensis TaxID=2484943 RepID=A0A4R9KFK5_9LEPT|nr:HD domain-containing protein [Leptospira sarikeiensis]TGL65950.1 metal-dependent phosphohydrolase [Leptospira sarikeiensis]
MDDWRGETKDRLSKSTLYNNLKEKCESDPSGSLVLALIDDATYFAYQRTKTILRHMGEFTLHDGDHLFRVLHLMERLLSNNIQMLSTPELMLLILGAFFHDIGMAPDERDVLAWKRIWDEKPEFNNEREELEYKKFTKFANGRPSTLEKIEEYANNGNLTQAQLSRDYLITDYIRITHAVRAKEIIQEHWAGKIKYRDIDLTLEFAELCFSHNDDATSLLALDVNLLCSPEESACLPLIGVILRIADILDFDAKRTPSILFSHLFVRNPISISEWNKHRSIQAWTISDKLIQFQAKCEHPAIESAIHTFCSYINKELIECNHILSKIKPELNTIKREINFNLPLTVDKSKIQTKHNLSGKPIYNYKETQFSLSKTQVIDLLMGTKLYGNPEVALRELLQNSIDACKLRKAMEDSWNNPYNPEINIRYYKRDSDDILEIEDNGIGMDQYIIDKYYSKIGSSFYKSADFYDLRIQSNANFHPTSRFGIGILSCFMVADSFEVETRKLYEQHSSSDPLNIVIEGQESIFWIREGIRKFPGTITKLTLRKSNNPWERMKEADFIDSVKRVLPNPPFKVNIQSGSESESIDETSFSLVTAESLRDYSWGEHENVKQYNVDLNLPEKGISGTAIIAILEDKNVPVEEIQLTKKNIDIEGESHDLTKSIQILENEIMQISTSISIDDDGKIETSNSHGVIARSKSRISLHGIDIPTNLFPEPWRLLTNQAKIAWPFPLLLVIDINGKGDLDLNSARNQILSGDKWKEFETALATLVCSGLKQQIDPNTWDILKDILLSKSAENSNFRIGLEAV